jgi:hypothetical protein
MTLIHRLASAGAEDRLLSEESRLLEAEALIRQPKASI